MENTKQHNKQEKRQVKQTSSSFIEPTQIAYFIKQARWPSWSKAHGSGQPDPDGFITISVSRKRRGFESHSCHIFL
ncbi:uncharacterized protein N7511_000931 [Penicillium nucicola]|uniref:uncharacterized protein n=1 Tax=Penicillium nucicola TaxID=1850975 RepID=UPI002545724F|nr:uncharacterized protein N7511_000931 [Penicillium nucicola]KAJ5775920.1 hypothetical protein N7511_000931 [Penicillium nucicola]